MRERVEAAGEKREREQEIARDRDAEQWKRRGGK